MSHNGSTSTPVQSAREAGLRYVSDSKAGLGRRRNGNGFRYFDANGHSVRDAATLARIRSLVIPPAWENVWICPSKNGHLQATGRDAKGRKQSRYHSNWRAVRDETKYDRMLDFGDVLPKIRTHVDHDLRASGLPRTKILATIVRLLETTSIRVGNEEYARTNHSFGLTTMRERHVDVEGSKITFHFEGKSGVRHTIDLRDRQVARIIQRCQDIPGYELFRYEDADGQHHSIDSADVNEYIRAVSGEDFTAKDFRTWAGTVSACRLLRDLQPFESLTEAKKGVVSVIKEVASALGNTPSVCRKCYVHPAVIERYMTGAMPALFKKRMSQALIRRCKDLEKDERALIQLLCISLAGDHKHERER